MPKEMCSFYFPARVISRDLKNPEAAKVLKRAAAKVKNQIFSRQSSLNTPEWQFLITASFKKKKSKNIASYQFNFSWSSRENVWDLVKPTTKTGALFIYLFIMIPFSKITKRKYIYSILRVEPATVYRITTLVAAYFTALIEPHQSPFTITTRPTVNLPPLSFKSSNKRIKQKKSRRQHTWMQHAAENGKQK